MTSDPSQNRDGAKQPCVKFVYDKPGAYPVTVRVADERKYTNGVPSDKALAKHLQNPLA